MMVQSKTVKVTSADRAAVLRKAARTTRVKTVSKKSDESGAAADSQ